MHRTSFADMACSIARTYDVVGEPWTPLILRDVWVGMNRFDALQADLGVSSKVLSARLHRLVDEGVLERVEYSSRPLRHEYALTQKGWELVDVLMAMTAWGDKWADGGAGPPVLLRHRACGKHTHASIRCAECGAELHAQEVDVEVGPGTPAAV